MVGVVIVGWDGGESARDAVALGEVLSDPARAELVIARVFRWEPGPAALHAVPPQRSEYEEREREAIAELEEVAGSVDGLPEVVASHDVAGGLEDLAAERGADMIVVGSSSRGGAHLALAGPVGLQLLRGSPCPVAVAPRRFRHRFAPDIRTIAAGYDGSEQAATMLDHVGKLALAMRARVRVIVVGAGGFEDGRPEQRLADALAALPPPLERSGVLLTGEPAPALLDEVANGVDLLAVGSTRKGPLRRALLGSVSSALAQEAPCPILVVPKGAAQASRTLPAVARPPAGALRAQ